MSTFIASVAHSICDFDLSNFQLDLSAAFLSLSLSLSLTLLETASSPGQLLCRPPMLLPSRAQLRAEMAKPKSLRRIPFGEAKAMVIYAAPLW